MFHSYSQRRARQTIDRMTRRLITTACCLLLASVVVMALPPTVVAQPNGQGEATQEAVGPVNERQALQIARARFPGNVISINEVRQNGRVRFRIRMDNEGNIFTVYIDKATGVVIEG